MLKRSASANFKGMYSMSHLDAHGNITINKFLEKKGVTVFCRLFQVNVQR